ncbi:DUF3817 domain-containing protein [Nesterenkonia ebinurensis]|uniref:DUF3817 domain-containing protein n=1 Tax=Nesterenkonia ebinurensis TaxID=2608252 RepID=UPI001CC54723|nr:DUF3817 domain-containing protein [Nesterenkonia ebinurensis]
MTTTPTAPAGPQQHRQPRSARGSLSWQKFMRIAFHTVAIIEAITWTGLLYAMYMRYIAGVPEAEDPVPFWGMVHGVAFMVFCVVATAAWFTFRWRLWEWAVALAMAVPPLMTIPLEIWYSRTGKLKPRVREVAESSV